MKRTILLLIFPLWSMALPAQQNEAADELIKAGVAYHDKGDYNAAIAKYDKALKLDKDNVYALAEKAYSLMLLGKLEEAVQHCQKAIETHPGDAALRSVYITYGNALDALNKGNKALLIYEEGIKQFPDYYQFYFNKGVTLAGLGKLDEGVSSLQKAVRLNPNHPGSHNGIARLSYAQHKNTPAVLAYCRFLALEPEGKRAAENLANMQEILKGNVEKTGKNSITISLNPNTGSDSTAGAVKPDNFSSVDLLLSLTAGLDYDKKYKKETDVERFTRKFGTLCAFLAEQKEKNPGFFWEYYVPYFSEMHDKKFIETFGYIAFASTENKDVSKWLKGHERELDEFFKWSEGFGWKTD